jgi:hypothetical protein
LKRREIGIIDVAADCGFPSQAHLTQVFRQHAGSPQPATVTISNTILIKPRFSIRRTATKGLWLLHGSTRTYRCTVLICDGPHPQHL